MTKELHFEGGPLDGLNLPVKGGPPPVIKGMIRIVTPEGDRYVAALIAHKLLERKLIITDNHGVLNAESLDELERLIAEYGMCDFCSTPEAKNTLFVPDFEMIDPVAGKVGESTGGWAACDDCHALVKADKRDDLLKRSQAMLGHGKYAAGAVKVLHGQFWKAWDSMVDAAGIGAAVLDFLNDNLPAPTEVSAETAAKNKRIAAIQRLTGMDADETAALLRGELSYRGVANKLVAWRKRFGNAEAKKLIDMVMRPPVMPTPGQQAHWQVALERKHEAISTLQKVLSAGPRNMVFRDPVDLQDPKVMRELLEESQRIQALQDLGYAEDLKHLNQSVAYSFNAETMAAIRMGAESIPHETMLANVTLPRHTAGFFWFAEPFPVMSSPEGTPTTNALLWGWEQGRSYHDFPDTNEPVLRMTALVVDDDGKIKPSTKWLWPRNMTFHQMIGINTLGHRKAYGPGGTFSKLPNLAGEKDTMKCVAELSLFFVMSCVWFSQKVLVSSPGHVERHTRKRLQKDFKLPEPPSVQVIALRASQRAEPSERAEGGVSERKYDRWSWVVGGHNRLQPCGPGLVDRKLIWVDAYVKGDTSKPLKPKGEKIYAVIR